MNPVEKAATCFGSHKEFAAKLGVHPTMISQMIRGDRKVPPAKCIDIEKLTEGVVTRHELRPDIFGSPEEAA